MFKDRLKESMLNTVLFIVALAFFIGFIVLITNFSLIKNIIQIILIIMAILTLITVIVVTVWYWINWQFIEPYKAHKNSKKNN